MLDALRELFAKSQPPGWKVDLYESGFITTTADEQNLHINIHLPFAAASWFDAWKQENGETIDSLAGGRTVQWGYSQDVATIKRSTTTPGIGGIRNIIAIASGKGGVGKSTTAVNLALALLKEGARVGLLDADIYGPSVPAMLGCQNERPVSFDGKYMQPIMHHGLACNSIGFLVPDDEAAIWRGPMASKALAQLLNETLWGELDYLVVDLPPGTGDIQLTMAQQVPTTVALIVTTPQDIALADAKKGMVMFNKMNIPVLGVVENMSYHICSQCGHHEPLFGSGGGDRFAKTFHVPLLAELPLHLEIRASMDEGNPIALRSDGNPWTEAYSRLARVMAARLYYSGDVIPSSLFTITSL